MLKVVEYRGFTVPSHLNKTQSEFYEKYESYDKIENIKEDIGDLVFDNKILLKWFKEKKLGASIRDTINLMKEKGVKDALIVADEGMTPNCKEIIKNLKSCDNIVVHVWTLIESMIFVPSHEFVPEHRICTLREKKNICKTYSVKKTQLPYIKSEDVMVKYLGAKKNQLIEIKRMSDTDPNNFILYYRIVV